MQYTCSERIYHSALQSFNAVTDHMRQTNRDNINGKILA